MNIEEVLKYVYEIADDLKLGHNKELAKLVVWVYDQGWTEGREDLSVVINLDLKGRKTSDR